jgi:hypothetical protein
MNKIFFVADLFYSDGFIGGAERCDNVLIQELFDKKYNNNVDHMLIKLNTSNLSVEIVEKNKDATYFVSNFMLLSEEVKQYLINNKIDYLIIDHDHKYVKSNDPSIYKQNLSNEEGLQNVSFYRNARAVVCQSSMHTEIVHKNLLINNIVNLSGNLWSEEDIEMLGDTLNSSLSVGERKIPWGVLNSNNPNKNVKSTISYCIRNNMDYQQIGSNSYKDFLKQVSACQGIVFFPKWIETFNRFSVEARVLGCKLKINQKVGASSDGWLDLKGQPLLDKIKSDKIRILNVYERLLNKKKVDTFTVEMPRVSIMTTFVDAEKYIEGFLKSLTEQTIFNEIDLIIYDAGSVGVESDIIKSYQKEYPNIHHIRDPNKIPSSEAFNKMMDVSNNDFVGMISIDDRPAPHYAEILRKYLLFSKTDLVYGDCVQTYEENDSIVDSFYSNNNLYEHSLNDFSKENMIKSLPGPMPMFKKTMIDKNGGFSDDYKHANDWELWLRCVRSGSKFFKVHSRVGLYYFNPNGITTSQDNFNSKIKEEAQLFMKYKDVIGKENFDKYKNYFRQGL